MNCYLAFNTYVTSIAIVHVPNKVRKKSNGLSSCMLTDAKAFRFTIGKFRNFLPQASAKPHHLFNQKSNSIPTLSTDCSYIRKPNNFNNSSINQINSTSTEDNAEIDTPTIAYDSLT